MKLADWLSIIISAGTFVTMIIMFYRTFRDPDIKADKDIDLLKQRYDLDRETNEKKFADFATRLDKSFTMASNHTHTVDVKVDKLIETTNRWHLDISGKMTELSTIINERMPKK